MLIERVFYVSPIHRSSLICLSFEATINASKKINTLFYVDLHQIPFHYRCVTCKRIDKDLYMKFWATISDRLRIPWCSGKGAIKVHPDIAVPLIIVRKYGTASKT